MCISSINSTSHSAHKRKWKVEKFNNVFTAFRIFAIFPDKTTSNRGRSGERAKKENRKTAKVNLLRKKAIYKVHNNNNSDFSDCPNGLCAVHNSCNAFDRSMCDAHTHSVTYRWRRRRCHFYRMHLLTTAKTLLFRAYFFIQLFAMHAHKYVTAESISHALTRRPNRSTSVLNEFMTCQLNSSTIMRQNNGCMIFMQSPWLCATRSNSIDLPINKLVQRQTHMHRVEPNRWNGFSHFTP